MNFTDYCIIGMVILWIIHTDREVRWWLALAIILVVAARLGYDGGMFGMLVAVGLWKIIKDIANQ